MTHGLHKRRCQTIKSFAASYHLSDSVVAISLLDYDGLQVPYAFRRAKWVNKMLTMLSQFKQSNWCQTMSCFLFSQIFSFIQKQFTVLMNILHLFKKTTTWIYKVYCICKMFDICL